MHYDEALRTARQISFRPALIGPLVGRAQWLASSGDTVGARIDLDEARERPRDRYDDAGDFVRDELRLLDEGGDGVL